MDTQIETSTENEFHLQTLGYVTSKNKAVESKIIENELSIFGILAWPLIFKITTL